VVPVQPTGSSTSVPSAADTEPHRRLVYGDESALTEEYRTHGGRVRGVAARVPRSPVAAEDVAQEVFAQLRSGSYAFDARRGSLRTWLSVPAHRRAVDRVRGEAGHRKHGHADDSAPHAIPDAGPAPGPDETVVDRERARRGTARGDGRRGRRTERTGAGRGPGPALTPSPPPTLTSPE
jgi:RNA polymerase sigma-70 factor (ECF subfamily)